MQLAKVCLPEELHHLIPDPQQHTILSPSKPAGRPSPAATRPASADRPAEQQLHTHASHPQPASQPSLTQLQPLSPLHSLQQLPFQVAQHSLSPLQIPSHHALTQQQAQQLQQQGRSPAFPAEPPHLSTPQQAQPRLPVPLREPREVAAPQQAQPRHMYGKPQVPSMDQQQAQQAWQERAGSGGLAEGLAEDDLEGLVGAVLSAAVGDLLLHQLQGNEFWADVRPSACALTDCQPGPWMARCMPPLSHTAGSHIECLL